jgi:ABC-type antimicrobial peptide transport system permease subunit
MKLVFFGLLLGGILAYVTARWIQSMLPGDSGISYLPYVAMVVLLGTIALVSSYLPARFALKADPRDALSEV